MYAYHKKGCVGADSNQTRKQHDNDTVAISQHYYTCGPQASS